MRQKLDALFRQGFVRSVGVLVGGTALAQALMVLILPLLTRLYSPEDFSVLAVYTAILGIISVAACLRLEIAIPLPQCDDDAVNLLALALCSSAGVAGLSTLIVALFPMQIITLFAQPKLEPYLWLLPLGIWLSSSYAALQFWTTRKKRFSVIAKTRMTQAIGGAGAQVGLGWASIAPLGLVLGQMINSGAGIFGLVRDALKNDRPALRAINWPGMQRTFSEYDRFPKYSTIESLANSASIQLPVIIIAALAAGPEAGFLMLASRVMFAPMALIGGAVSQVYLSRAPDEFRKGTLGAFTANIMGGLVKTGVGPLIFAGIVAPVAFPFIFGAQWQRAGEMVAWMTPWFVMQFISSPISMTLHVTQSQRTALTLQILGFFMRVGAVVAAAHWAQRWIVEIYAASGFIFYLVYVCVVVAITNIRIKNLLNVLKPGFFIAVLWIILSIMLRVVHWKLT
ncbi:MULTISPECIES: oligosaccharide flippase family protein [unclassified Polaromonas]|uniref:oligosaccharide flippase family protein n=1 Tax=unclassified Polaromonas TaxID=2638319 RepID=UPI0018CB2803|nr:MULTISPECIES: oligosaccharide flippase family protein [unclassified Polaromonas]MBG6073080.1 O-antigen/teichoic acid export membrane protein [Polaromonas sp. CG_9.7]MBG6115085.1 O-antigen/teichoic acid export membrane protein [Polaromonas sp. CG_9.2]